MKRLIVTALCAFVATAPSWAQDARPERAKVHIGVGGKAALYYLPLTITERLGYFKEQGLEVEISDFQGGSKSMQALVGGSVDVVAGAYEHTITIQSKGQDVVAFVAMGRYPGYAFGIAKARAASYKSPKDLKGMKIGVTAPGSGTQTFAEYLLKKDGLKASDVAFIGVGASTAAAAALRAGQIDAISNIDPVMTLLEASGDVVIISDVRTTKGTMEAFGTAMPAATLYTTKSFADKNPRTVQALANAVVKALKWLQTATPEQVAETVPATYLGNDRGLYLQSFGKIREGLSPDGAFPRDGIENTLKMLRAASTEAATANVRLDDTYTNRFAEQAQRALKR